MNKFKTITISADVPRVENCSCPMCTFTTAGKGLGFKEEGLGFRNEDLGFKGEDSGFKDEDLGFKDEG